MYILLIDKQINTLFTICLEIFPEIKDQLHNRTLHFDKYSLSMRGKYKCIAENKYGIRGNSSAIDGILFHDLPRFVITGPQDCSHYADLFLTDLSKEYTGVVGGNVTMSCKSQYGCQFIEECLENIEWDESKFPPDRTLRINGSSCSSCTSTLSLYGNRNYNY